MNASSRIALRALTQPLRDETSALLVRLECELEFARLLCDALPADQTQGWQERIAVAQARWEAFAPQDSLPELVEVIESDLEPIGLVAKNYRILCSGHGHIDMNWLWNWPETVAATHDTFRVMLDFMDRFPGFTYSQSQASVYALTERYYPELFERIQRKVQEGQWEITASTWVEGDKNLASGESMTRHLLLTRAYMKEKFGLDPEHVQVDWEPDQFGHANTVPTILRQGGVRWYYCCRPGGGDDHARIGPERPRLFRWRGPDGSEVLVNRESTWYNSYVNIGDNVAAPMCAFLKETGLSVWLNVYGVGNHGGGPTRTETEYLLSMKDWPIYPTVEFGTVRGFFEAVEKEIAQKGIELPVLDHELNFEFTGCYTSQSAIKRFNRHGENYCTEAETLQAVTDLDVEKGRMDEAWTHVLFGQFHDILPGSGVPGTREYQSGLFQETSALTGSIKRRAGIQLAQDLDTASMLPTGYLSETERELIANQDVPIPFEAGAGMVSAADGVSVVMGGGKRFLPFLVYNPCDFARSEVVKVSLYDIDMEPGHVVVRDPDGRQFPTLFLGQEWAWGHQKYNFLVPVMDVPPLGYKTVLFCEGTPNAELPGALAKDQTAFATPHVLGNVDRFGSGLAHWQAGALAGHGLGRWEYVNENPRGMTAWVLGQESKIADLSSGRYRTFGMSRNEGTGLPTGSGSILVYDQKLAVPGTESIVQLKTLVSGLAPRVDWEATVDWREIGTQERGVPGLVTEFSCLEAQKIVCETPFGWVERDPALREEFPSLRYVHLEGAFGGLTLLQDCKYGFSYRDGALRMRVVRASFDPDHAPEVGISKLRYAVVFHQEAPSKLELTRLGAAFNHPLMVFPAPMQHGTAPLTRSFAQVEGEGIALTALKKAHDGDGLVLRLVNYSTKPATGLVRLSTAGAAGYQAAQVVDLMERPTEGDASWAKGVLKAEVPARSFLTVKLT